MEILKQLHVFIEENTLFFPQERVLLAVSAGRDSILMAQLFKNAGFNFGIAHCNFKLRGTESDQDEQFTKNLAQELDVPFYCIEFDTQAYADDRHISIQMAARDLRYTWLEKIRTDYQYQYIALAHHKNDVIETMLLNLTRGTGISGLHGILPKKGKLIRPLLFLNRHEIDIAVQDEGYVFREDSSNLSVKYSRNRIRLEVIPVLKELNPSLEHTFEANRKRFSELEILLDIRIQEARKQAFKELNEDEFEISIAELKRLNPLNLLLYGLFHPFGFSEPVLTDLSNSWDGKPGKIFQSTTHQILLDRKRIILSKRYSKLIEDVLLDRPERSIIWNEREFKGNILPIDQFVLNKNGDIAQLDFDLLEFPLKIRSWKNGDYFHPLGLSNKKKISDFFVDQKILLNHKKDIGIIENKNGDIIWVAGLRIDERYKITANTKKVFIFEQLD